MRNIKRPQCRTTQLLTNVEQSVSKEEVEAALPAARVIKIEEMSRGTWSVQGGGAD